jgi:hypothetical protein
MSPVIAEFSRILTIVFAIVPFRCTFCPPNAIMSSPRALNHPASSQSVLFTMLIPPGSFFRTRVVEYAFYLQAPTGLLKCPGLYATFRIFCQRLAGLEALVGLDSPQADSRCIWFECIRNRSHDKAPVEAIVE